MSNSETLVVASDHTVRSVTVFKSNKAEVVRTFAIKLDTGHNKFRIGGLSGALDTQSVRVSGLPPNVRLYDVVTTLGDMQDAHRTFRGLDPVSETIRTLKNKKDQLIAMKKVREKESETLVQYSQTLSAEHVSPDNVLSYLTAFVARGQENVRSLAQVNEQIFEVTREIDAETVKASQTKGSLNGEVTVILGTKAPVEVEMTLTYIVSHAFWRPSYELHGKTVDGRPSADLVLHYRAQVRQETGENWSNARLTLSTITSDTFLKRIPTLHPVKLTHPQQISSVFGVKNTNTSNVGTAFGNNNNTNAGPVFGQPSFGASAFGAQPAQPQPAVGGLFGSSSSQPVSGSAGGLFGSSTSADQQQQQQQQQRISIFGAPTGFGLFGGGSTSQQQQQQQQRQQASTTTQEHEEPTEEFEDLSLEEGENGDEKQDRKDGKWSVKESQLAISYSVEDQSDIPSDGKEHLVSVASVGLKGKISHIAVPRMDRTVYLQCHVKNTSDYRLLPGPVTILMDDSFVSKASIGDINTGDSFSCTLGDDVGVVLTYKRHVGTPVRSEGGSFADVNKMTKYESKVTVTNKHQFPITELVIKDVLPTPPLGGFGASRVKVYLRKPEELSKLKNGEEHDLGDGKSIKWINEKDGKLEWVCKDIEATKEVNFELEWEVKSPADFTLWETIQNPGGLFGKK